MATAGIERYFLSIFLHRDGGAGNRFRHAPPTPPSKNRPWGARGALPEPYTATEPAREPRTSDCHQGVAAPGHPRGSHRHYTGPSFLWDQMGDPVRIARRVAHNFRSTPVLMTDVQITQPCYNPRGAVARLCYFAFPEAGTAIYRIEPLAACRLRLGDYGATKPCLAQKNPPQGPTVQQSPGPGGSRPQGWTKESPGTLRPPCRSSIAAWARWCRWFRRS